jgi:hypothetical protein
MYDANDCINQFRLFPIYISVNVFSTGLVDEQAFIGEGKSFFCK